MACPTVLLNQGVGWNPGTIGGNQVVSIPLGDFVPQGASGALLTIGIGNEAPAGAAVDSLDLNGMAYGAVATQVSGQYANGFMIAPFDASGNIRIKNMSGATFRLWVWLLGYF